MLSEPPPAPTFGPPAHDVFAETADLPSTAAALDASLKHIEPDAAAPAGDGAVRYRGTMCFDHISLVGPPIRLQGGLHGIGRLLPVLRRVAPEVDVDRAALAMSLHLGAPIDLFENVPFAAVHRRLADGRQTLSTRLRDTPRLDGLVWTPGVADDALMDVDLPAWRRRVEALSADPHRQRLMILSQIYTGNADLLVSEVNVAALLPEAPGFRRFVDDGWLGRPFLAYQLDNVGVLARAIEIGQPCFTTRISLLFAAGQVAVDEPLLLVADRRGAAADRHSSARPVAVAGRPEATRIVPVLATDRACRRVIGRGWVHSHPIDLSRLRLPG